MRASGCLVNEAHVGNRNLLRVWKKVLIGERGDLAPILRPVMSVSKQRLGRFGCDCLHPKSGRAEMCTSPLCQAHNHRAGIAEVATQCVIRSAYHRLAVRDQRCGRNK
jgi:hypothetical protein